MQGVEYLVEGDGQGRDGTPGWSCLAPPEEGVGLPWSPGEEPNLPAPCFGSSLRPGAQAMMHRPGGLGLGLLLQVIL